MVLDIWTVLGFAGSIVVLVAYFANQTGRMSSDDWHFPFLNLVGSLMILSSF